MRVIVLCVAVALSAVFAAAALAAGNEPAKHVYHHQGTNIQNTLGESGTLGTKASTSTGSGNLPFTGLDLTLIVGAGVVLVGMGFSLRRVARRPKPPTA